MNIQPTVPPPPTGEFGVAPAAEALPVIIAAQDIARGTQITSDMLAVVYWPPDLLRGPNAIVPADFSGFYSAVVQVAGLYAVEDIVAYLPITGDATQPGPLDN
jgi:Flp pilus assembly protein CpaB